MSTDPLPLSRSALLVLLLVVAAVWFAGLECRTLMHPDEGRYSEIAREMAVSGDWLTPRLNGLKYFEKPPLQYWATAAAFDAFGIHNWTARLWPALTTFAATLFIGFVGLKLGGPAVGFFAAASLASSTGFLVAGHFVSLDGALSAFLAVALGAFLLAQRDGLRAGPRRAWMWVAWAAMAAATLSKGLIGVVIPGASLVAYSLATRDFRVWRRLHLASGLVLYFALAAPWFVAVSRANPEFFRFFFIHEHFERYLTTTHRRAGGWSYYLPYVLGGSLPWLFVLLWGARRTWRDGVAAANGFSWQRFAVVWVIFVVLFFSASGSKLPAYIAPIFPALALLAGRLLARYDAKTLFRLTLPLAVAAVAMLALVLFMNEARLERLTGRRGMATIAAYLPWLRVALGVMAAGSLAALFAFRRTRPDARTAGILALALSALVAVQLGLVGFDVFRTTRSAWDILQSARTTLGASQDFDPRAPFYQVHLYDQTVPFYLGRTTTLVEYRDEMALGIDAEPQRAIPTEELWFPVWKALDQGYALILPDEYDDFVAKGLPMRLLARDDRRVLVSRR
jgi:4-amino-4-deoxy-L-arabinose transferase-like glycosyltransferase